MKLAFLFLGLYFSSLSIASVDIHVMDSLLLAITKSNEKEKTYNELSELLIQDSTEKAEQFTMKALEMARKSKNLTQEARAFQNLGIIYQIKGNYSQSIKNFQLALAIRLNMKEDHDLANTLNSLGTVYQLNNENYKALDLYLRALDVAQKINDKKYMAKAYNNIGIIYKEQSLFDKALIYFEKSLHISEELKDLGNTAYSLNNIGLVYKMQGKFQEALDYITKSYEVKKKLGNLRSMAFALNNMANIYLQLKQYEKVKLHLDEAHKIQQEIQDTVNSITTFINYAGLYTELKNNDKAILYLQKASSLAEKFMHEQARRQVYTGLAALYAHKKDYYNAYLNLTKYSNLSDSLNSTEINRSITEMQAKFETSEKEKENEILRKNSEIQILQIEKFKNTRLLLLFSLALLIALIGFIYRSFKLNKKTNQLLVERNQQIEQMNAELSTMNDDLEQKVDERTHKLQDEISQREVIEKQLKEALDKTEKANLLKEAFLTNISHEIRTPLNGIMGFTNLLRNPDNSYQQQISYIENINTCSMQLMGVIGDIIEISRLETKQLVLANSEIHITNLMQDVFFMVQSELSRKNKSHIEIRKPQDENANFVFIGDMEKIEQTFKRLINNAVKYTNIGFIDVGYEINQKNNSIVFYVKDSGIGMSPQEFEYIFEQFRQADNSLKRVYGGTGLGLAICKGYVQLMGGRIWVESVKELGSGFYFELPTNQITESVSEEPKTKKAGNIDWSEKTILIVEDDLYSQKYLTEALRSTHIQILTAEDGGRAIELCATHPEINLVLLDIQIPVINGFDATREIKKLRADIVVIAQTANALSHHKIRCIEAGCDNYIAKPIIKEKLFEMLSLYM